MVRIKNRYLLVNILYPELEKGSAKFKVPDVVAFNQPTTDQLTSQELLRALRKEVSALFGDYGSGATSSSLAVKYLSPATSTFILRVSRAHYRMVWATLSLMTGVPVKDGKNCVFQVVRVSGTIRKAEEEAIRRARDMISRARREMEGKGDSTLDSIFGKDEYNDLPRSTDDLLMVDKSDSEEEGLSHDDG